LPPNFKSVHKVSPGERNPVGISRVVPGKAVLIATLYFNASHRCIAQISIGASGRSKLANVLCRYAEISETL
jgi:hypothetical protein